MKITKQPLPPTQYFQRPYKKTNLVLHGTVSSTAQSARQWWMSNPEKVATAYIIEKTGEVIQLFDDKHWAHHLGIRSGQNLHLNQCSIGIELVNEGYLWPQDNGQFRWLHPDGPIYTGRTLTIPEPWRGCATWPIYTMAQISTLGDLITLLCEKHNIPRTFAPQGVFDMNIPYKYGIYAHHNVRLDKTDVSPALNYDLL